MASALVAIVDQEKLYKGGTVGERDGEAEEANQIPRPWTLTVARQVGLPRERLTQAARLYAAVTRVCCIADPNASDQLVSSLTNLALLCGPDRSTRCRRLSTWSVLYPSGLVSPRQKRQLTCWGDNVLSLRVDGTFDDCQGLVKEAFRDPVLSRNASLQLRQQHQYRALAAADGVLHRLQPRDRRERTGMKPSYIIPAGNLGNACAALWARAMGFPLGAHHPGAQHQSHGSGFPGNGPMAAPAQHRDARLGHGCGKSQQHGAHSRALSDLGDDARTFERGQRR